MRGDATERDRGLSLGEIGMERFAPYLISRALRRWFDSIRDVLREHDLSINQMRILGALTVRMTPSVQELSQYTNIEPSTMSRTLDSLERRGLVRRETRSDDGRLRVVAPTEAGLAVFAAIWPGLRDLYEQMMDGIEPAERDAFLATLHKVNKNLQR